MLGVLYTWATAISVSHVPATQSHAWRGPRSRTKGAGTVGDCFSQNEGWVAVRAEEFHYAAHSLHEGV